MLLTTESWHIFFSRQDTFFMQEIETVGVIGEWIFLRNRLPTEKKIEISCIQLTLKADLTGQ